jgi:radical SAM-linked protein
VKHELANPPDVVLGKNPFVKKAVSSVVPEAPATDDNHPSLQFQKPQEPPANTTVCKLVVEFKKTGELRFIGHLDLQHLLVRAARRAKIFVSYSEGFNPSPKLSLALSLALYNEGLAEVGEIELSEHVSPEDFVSRMNAQLPPDVQFTRARAVEKGGRSIAQAVGRATYRAVLNSSEQLPLDGDTIQRKLSEILASSTLEVETTPNNKGKHKHGSKGRDERKEPSTRDIRPGIYSLKVSGNDATTIELELAHGPRLHVKPSDVLKFVVEEGDWRITRVGLANDDGKPLFDA